jgi:hypothetical protein
MCERRIACMYTIKNFRVFLFEFVDSQVALMK